MITSHGRLLLPLLLCLTGASTVACSSGSPAAGVKAVPSSAVTATKLASAGTPSPTPATTSPADVEADVRAWFVAVNRAFSTGDTKDLRQHTELTCGCLKLVRNIENAWSAGQIRGLRWTLGRLDVVYINQHVATVEMSFDETPYEVIAVGSPSSAHKADRITALTRFAFKNDLWRLWTYSQERVDAR